MKSHTEYLTFETRKRREMVHITDKVEEIVRRSGVKDGLCFVSPMHITAAIYVNDHESGLIEDIEKWLEELAPARPDYKHHQTGESYANSVQVRVSVWDFQLVFGLASSETPDQVNIRNHQAIFLSPQQAKALWNVLGQNLAQYEQAFGALSLEPKSQGFPSGPVN